MSVNLAAFYVVQKMCEAARMEMGSRERPGKERGKRPSEAPSLQSELNEI
jgi:hypothetical protein